MGAPGTCDLVDENMLIKISTVLCLIKTAVPDCNWLETRYW